MTVLCRCGSPVVKKLWEMDITPENMRRGNRCSRLGTIHVAQSHWSGRDRQSADTTLYLDR